MNAILESISSAVKTIWAKYKALVVLIAGAILALGYHKIVMDYLVSKANEDYNDAKKKSSDLRSQEFSADTESKLLEQKAADLSEQEKKEVITPDWDQK